MKKKAFLLTLFLSLTYICNAQYNNYVEGYVLKNDGDTLWGYIKILNREESCFKLKFKNLNGKNVSINSRNIYGYKRGHELYLKKKYTRPLSLYGQHAYMKVLIQGELNLYQYNYVINYSGTGANGTPTYGGKVLKEDFYIEKKGELILVKKSTFKNNISEFLSDKPSVSERILSYELQYKHIYKIVELYNKEI